MSQKKYIKIDTHILTEGLHVEFDIFETNETKKSMKLFITKNSLLNSNDKIRLREVSELYINSVDLDKFEEYSQSHLQTIAQNPNIPLEKKSAMVYDAATKSMLSLFDNPESLAHAQTSKVIVGSVMHLLTHDNATVESMMQIVANDYYTHTHSLNVSIYALCFGQFLKFSDEDLSRLGESAMLHDLGKSKVDWAIINKNGKLTDEEFDSMKKHPASGDTLAKKLGITDKDILSGIRHHHEKMDGNGYPDKLFKKDISLFARIIGICDVFDALTTKRSYKEAMHTFNAISIMRKDMATHLDQQLVISFIKMFNG